MEVLQDWGQVMELRPYQTRCLAKVRERKEAGVNRQLASLATGLGKGALTAALRTELQLPGKVMMLVHTDELAQGAVKKLTHWNPGQYIGTEMGMQRSAPMDNFVVGSVATLGRKGSSRIEKFHPADFSAIVSDEVHHLPGDSRWQRVLEHFGLSEPNPEGILHLGVTATPNRSDGKGLRPWCDEVVFDMGILEGIQQGYLVDLKCFRVKTDVSLDSVPVSAGKFNDAALTKEINTAERNGRVVKAWAKYAFGVRTIVFTQNVQHALDLAAAFEAFGIAAKAVWGEDPERDSKVQGHRSGEFPVLLNAQMLREGYDDPEIECVVLASPDMSALPFAQKVGRVTRIPDDVSRLYGDLIAAREADYPISKEFGIVIDIADSSFKHPLISVPSLMGMPKDLDLKGKTIMQAREKLERVAADFPTANLSDLQDLDRLDAIAEQVSLFQVRYPLEVSKLTDLAWTKQGDAYAITVDRNRLVLAQDLRGDWVMKGSIGETAVEVSAQNLAGAFNAADAAILAIAVGKKYLLTRDAGWRDNGPSDKQVALCAKLRLPIPNGATRGQVSAALDAHFSARRI
jgi:superfamily II DNA or RNA helicase